MASGGSSFQISGLWTAYPQSKWHCAHSEIGYILVPCMQGHITIGNEYSSARGLTARL